MKQTLTIEQLQFIENALIEKCDFKDFNDLRLEMVDHLAFDIEEEMNTNNSDFRTAFIKVFFKNNSIIASNNRFPYGRIPHFVYKIWSKLDLKYNFLVFLFSILLTYICYSFIENGVSQILLFSPFIVIGTISNIFLLYRKRKNKIPTTLSQYAFRKIILNTYGFYSLVFLNCLFFLDNKESNLFVIYCNLIFYSLLMIARAFWAHKSIKIENQLLQVI